MRKSTFFWSEFYRLAPVAVERCACVWMLNGARAQMRMSLEKQVRAEMEQAQTIGKEQTGQDGQGSQEGQEVQEGKKDHDGQQDQEAQDALVEQGVAEIMAYLDGLHQQERLVVLSVLLSSGLLLTLQPWLSLNFFSLPLLLAGAMLLGLEFSPRTGEGIAGMARRFKQGFGSEKS